MEVCGSLKMPHSDSLKARHPSTMSEQHFLSPKSVPEFAVRLAGILIISLVMPYGWVGASDILLAQHFPKQIFIQALLQSPCPPLDNSGFHFLFGLIPRCS